MVCLAKNKTSGLCRVKFCRRKTYGGNCRCSMHMMQEWRAKNPIKAAFAHIKDKAKRRHIQFDLTIEQFTEFCERTAYHEGVGRERFSLSVDRIRNSEGYHIDNIQVLTVSQNAAKGCRMQYVSYFQK